jgi:acyl-CoA thioester hydrolase
MPAPAFQHVHRVTYADCTVGNHIYYSRYLDLLEAARGEFFRSLGSTLLQWQERDVVFPVIECRLRYRAPARYDDVLTTEVWPTLAERMRLNFAHRMVNAAGRVLLEAETFHVCAGVEEKLSRLPEDLLAMLAPWLQPSREGA